MEYGDLDKTSEDVILGGVILMFWVGVEDAYMYKMPRLHSTSFSVSVHHTLFTCVLFCFWICSVSAFQRVCLALPYLTLCFGRFLIQGSETGTGRLNE